MQNRDAYKALMKVYPFTTDTLNGEIWRNVEGYGGNYQVSNLGRVKSLKGKTPRILKPAMGGNSYLFVVLCGESHQQISIHRLVAEAFIPNPDNKPQVNHIDNHILNNSVENLEWVTVQENQQHAVRTNATNVGEKNYRAVLTNEQVAWCRNVYVPMSREFGMPALARKLNKNPATVRLAILGKTYKSAGT